MAPDPHHTDDRDDDRSDAPWHDPSLDEPSELDEMLDELLEDESVAPPRLARVIDESEELDLAEQDLESHDLTWEELQGIDAPDA